jgi:toxin ParE1/3/4
MTPSRSDFTIEWSRLAQARLQEILAFIALEQPAAAEHLATRIVTLVETLRKHPQLGRAGIDPSIRELVVGGTPYSIPYRVHGRKIVITTIWHAPRTR